MAWTDEPDHPFLGIAEKLKRADQNIVNLDSEINAFIQGGKYPVIPDPNTEEWYKVLAYHRDKPIPLRFSVLAGEVVHHLRSCLDHIAWHFSDAATRIKDANGIEFPIFEHEPTNREGRKRRERKIQGITNANVLSLIEEMQPYKVGPDAANHSLLILHNMDRFDKHRELVIINSTVQVSFPPNMDDIRGKADLFHQGKLPQSEIFALSRALQDDLKATPSVGFRNFGQWSPYPVIKGLADLCVAVENSVGEFAAEV